MNLFISSAFLEYFFNIGLKGIEDFSVPLETYLEKSSSSSSSREFFLTFSTGKFAVSRSFNPKMDFSS